MVVSLELGRNTFEDFGQKLFHQGTMLLPLAHTAVFSYELLTSLNEWELVVDLVHLMEFNLPTLMVYHVQLLSMEEATTFVK